MGEQDSLLKNFVEIDIEKLCKAPWNYKEEDEFLQTQLEENIKRNGQIENIIVRELPTGFYEVVNGNHRYEAMKTIGLTKVVAYNLGDITEAQAQRVAIATNETRFKTDQVKLTHLMDELSKTFGVEDLKMDLPYTQEQIENFTNLLNFDWSNPTQGSSGDGSNAPPSPSGDDFKVLSFKLPLDVAFQLEAQIERFKAALHPEEDDLEAVSPVMAIQAMVQHLIQIPEDQLLT